MATSIIYDHDAIAEARGQKERAVADAEAQRAAHDATMSIGFHVLRNQINQAILKASRGTNLSSLNILALHDALDRIFVGTTRDD